MNQEQLNEKWHTHSWYPWFKGDELSEEKLIALNEAELFLTDFDLWTSIKKSGVCEDFEMQYGECSLLYTLWYEGILQYVGKSHCFSRRVWQHFNAAGSSDAQYDPNKVKLFDEIRYIEVPSPEPCWDFSRVMEKELMYRYNLMYDQFGYMERKWAQPNYIRTSMNYLDYSVEQMTFDLPA